MTVQVLKPATKVESIDTGIEKSCVIANEVEEVMANSYVLMAKTQAVHWNVVGPLFTPIHTLTQEHYEDLFEAIDVLAERIRSLGFPAPSSLGNILEKSTIAEAKEGMSAESMILDLSADHAFIAAKSREVIHRAEEFGDAVTADLLTTRIAFHEKALWMLNSILAK